MFYRKSSCFLLKTLYTIVFKSSLVSLMYWWIPQMLGDAMEQRTSKNVNNCFNSIIYSYLETSGGQSLNQYLNVVHFFNTSVN
jgi:hypothetical protein